MKIINVLIHSVKKHLASDKTYDIQKFMIWGFGMYYKRTQNYYKVDNLNYGRLIPIRKKCEVKN